MERRRLHLTALLGCLLVLTAGVWLSRAGTVRPAPTVVYVDMAMTARLVDKNAADYWAHHPLPPILSVD